MPNRILVLILMFVGASCTAATVPYMGLFIVEQLGKEPWTISIFSALETVLVLIINRYLGNRIDEGGDIRKYLCYSVLAFIIGVAAVLIAPNYWTIVTIYALGLAIASGSVSIMFSFARFYADAQHIDSVKFNMQVRAMASLAWMVAPAAAFAMAGIWGHMVVFEGALFLGFIWLIVWWFTFREPFHRPEPTQSQLNAKALQIPISFNTPLWAAAFACMFIALANALVLSASALFYVREVHLPAAAPGLALTVKCFFEVVIILGAPKLLKRAGLRNSLIFSAFLAAGCFVYLSQINSLTEMFVASAMEGIYFGIFAACSVSFVQSFARGRIGHATSLFTNSMSFGGMLGGATMGIIASYADYRSVILLGSFAALGAIIMLVATRRYDEQAEQLPA